MRTAESNNFPTLVVTVVCGRGIARIPEFAAMLQPDSHT